ncbi:TPA: phage baseplate assembly protein V [Pseudomonas aeruginosa]
MSSLEFGDVEAVDYASCRVRVRLDERDGLVTYWLHVPQRHTQGTKVRPLMPEIGEQVAVLLEDDGVEGVVLGGVYSAAEPPPVADADTHYIRFSDGSSVTYDRKAHQMAVQCVGAVTLKCTGPLTVEAGQSVMVKAPAVTLDTPQTTLQGNLQVNGNINATGAVMDAGGNSNHHTH